MYAIIRTGGKQYRVRENDVVVIERLPGEAGDAVTLNEVLYVGGEETEPRFGTPNIEGATVQGTIVEQAKGTKIHGLTYIKVKGHQKHYGHRQLQTRLRIVKIAA